MLNLMVGEIAFVPIEVLLVTLIIERALSVREKRNMLEKMNMVIGVFYSEVGFELLRKTAFLDQEIKTIGQSLGQIDEDVLLQEIRVYMKRSTVASELSEGYIKSIHEFLSGKRNFLLRLLENPNLLEHDDFTELLWALFHLNEELMAHSANKHYSDLEHIQVDLFRVYKLLVKEWLEYMEYLKVNYPFLYKFALKTNPFIV
jgi:hypothetical protein